MDIGTPDIGHPRSITPLDAAWRVAFRIGFRVACAWWSLRRPQHHGVQAVIWVNDRLLLLRSSYRFEWNFPGGGVRPGETSEQALRRELAEEIGLEPDALSPAGSASGIWEGREDRVEYFELRLARVPEVRFDNREIVGARLFRAKELEGVPVTGPVEVYLERMAATGLQALARTQTQKPRR